ncbi:MAG: hypothetical protein KF791_13460 [Verrucomicrobiae bacterium]|nr:hypothetical protein [Verrucomicrobiae bacterium]
MNSQGLTDYEREAHGPRLVVFDNSRSDFGSRAFGRALTNADLAELARAATGNEGYGFGAQVPVLHYGAALHLLGELQGWRIASLEPQPELQFPIAGLGTRKILTAGLLTQLAAHEITLAHLGGSDYLAYPRSAAGDYQPVLDHFSRTRGLAGVERLPLPAKAPPDSTWLNPFGPLTTKAARAATPVLAAVPAIETGWSTFSGSLYPRDLVDRLNRILQRPNKNWMIEDFSTATTNLLVHYARFVANNSPIAHGAAFQLSTSPNLPPLIPEFEWRGLHIHEVIKHLERTFRTNGITVLRQHGNQFIAFPAREAVINPINPRPYALLYTYSLIIALVCGTAGLPHILVRFYTNPDGVAAKRTTMWVMILIGVFYVFPPMFGVMGRNLMPSLYEGTGVNGTDGIVLKLPTVLGERLGPLGSILSGITCAGAFAAFMSTFSGLLVSMTGAMAHDVYGRILNPGSTPAQRLRMFKVAAVGIGAVAIGLGTLVENFEINFMVGQAFAIAAASYFPLLFMSVWWRGMTTHGAATGMLTGGLLAVAAISLTSWTTFVTAQAAKFQALGRAEPGWFSALRDHSLVDFWAAHPLLRILCEQPAIWAVPLAILLMIVVSLRTRHAVPGDVREKMLVLHAPEALGLRQDYIRDHEH